MLEQKSIYCSNDQTAADKYSEAEPGDFRDSIGCCRRRVATVIRRERVHLPVTRAEPRHRVGVKHDWLAGINLHGTPQRKG